MDLSRRSERCGWLDARRNRLRGLEGGVAAAASAATPAQPAAGGATPAADPQQGRIEIRGLTKRFGRFRPSTTSTSMSYPAGSPASSARTARAGDVRMLLGLIRPTEAPQPSRGVATTTSPTALAVVGSALESTNFHRGTPGATLLTLAAASRILSRVDEMLELVGIPAAASKRRRLLDGHAAATRARGRPARRPARHHPRRARERLGPRWHPVAARVPAPPCAEGRTLLISSHMLSEVEQTVDDVVIIANGKRVAQGTIEELGASRPPSCARPIPTGWRAPWPGGGSASSAGTAASR